MPKESTTMHLKGSDYTFEYDFDTQGLRLSWSGNQTFLNPEETIALGDFLFEVLSAQGNPPRILPMTVNSIDIKSEGGPVLRHCPYCQHWHEPHLIEQCPLKPKQGNGTIES